MKLRPYEKAGRLFRLIGWISAVGAVGGVAALLLEMTSDQSKYTTELLPSVVVMGLLAVLLLKVGGAIKQHVGWGRPAGIGIAALQLLAFPVGTLIGAYILWCLIKGWEQPEASPALGERRLDGAVPHV